MYHWSPAATDDEVESAEVRVEAVTAVLVTQALLAALYEPPAEAATTVTVIAAVRVPVVGEVANVPNAFVCLYV
jgi:hypothetical protein